MSQRFDGYLRGCLGPFSVNRYYSESPTFYVSGPSAVVGPCVAAGLSDRAALALAGPPLCKPCLLSQLRALMFLLFTPHPAPSSRLGCLPGQHLDMNPRFLSANHRSFSLITSRRSDSLRGQLGCISLGAVHLMFKMFMPCLSCRWPGPVFNIMHKQVCTVRSHHCSAVFHLSAASLWAPLE